MTSPWVVNVTLRIAIFWETDTEYRTRLFKNTDKNTVNRDRLQKPTPYNPWLFWMTSVSSFTVVLRGVGSCCSWDWRVDETSGIENDTLDRFLMMLPPFGGSGSVLALMRFANQPPSFEDKPCSLVPSSVGTSLYLAGIVKRRATKAANRITTTMSITSIVMVPGCAIHALSSPLTSRLRCFDAAASSSLPAGLLDAWRYCLLSSLLSTFA